VSKPAHEHRPNFSVELLCFESGLFFRLPKVVLLALEDCQAKSLLLKYVPGRLWSGSFCELESVRSGWTSVFQECVPITKEDLLEGPENGGCRDCETNLWPQPYGDADHLMTITQRRAWDKGHPRSTAVLPAALQKDEVESYVHDETCFDVPNHKVTSKKAFAATASVSHKDKRYCQPTRTRAT